MAQHFHTGDGPRIVDLPHDYMIESDVSADDPAGAASGFYTAGPAYYTRLVDIPAAWAGQEVFLQLDGAMMNATVEVNGSRAALQHNGYIPFAVRLTPYLTFGEENRITVNLNPSMQPNSRWYTGAGVFRSVQLLHLPGLHIAPDGIFGYTRSLDWRDGAAVLAHLQAAVEVYNATGQARLAEAVHALDPSRPVTNAICSYWNGTDDATAREIAAKILASGGGVLQNIQGDSAGDTDWERRSEAFTNGLDVVGYNYMEDKYEQDHALYPQRVILGTENYAREIGVHWPLVEKLPYVLGDFTWTACDYIGEAGLGKGMMLAPDDPQLPAMQMGAIQQSGYPWRLADDADLDLTGHRLPQGDYRSIVWGSEATALFSYDPADFGKVEVLSRWGFPGVQRCWTWPGAEGKPARVVVFSRAQEVVLLQNGAKTARAQAGAATLPDLPLSFVFEVPYTPGKLEAVSYQDGREISRDALETTGAPAALRLTAEGALRADGHSVACVWAEVVDAAGRVVPNAAPALTAGLSGAGTLAGFGSANPITTVNYAAGRCHAYRGQALAVVRAGYAPGSATLTVTAEGLPTASLTLAVAPADSAV